MLRVLLVSDTHGSLDAINLLAKSKRADLVIHAGDFGFYEDQSVDRLSTRELRLLVVHSPYKEKLSDPMNRRELVDLIQAYGLLGVFPDYMKHEKEFDVPIYAVWGNHEDHEVIEALREGNKIRNLHLLDENQHYKIAEGKQEAIQLYGLGGNFLVNQKAFASTFQGSGGKVQATFHQLGMLCNNVGQLEGPSIFVSHVSPDKEPLLCRLMAHFAPTFWVSGHMGAPFTHVWKQPPVQSWEDLQACMPDLSEIRKHAEFSAETKRALELLKAPVKKLLDRKNATWNINLPDMHEGCALLLFNENNFALEILGTPTGISDATDFYKRSEFKDNIVASGYDKDTSFQYLRLGEFEGVK